MPNTIRLLPTSVRYVQAIFHRICTTVRHLHKYISKYIVLHLYDDYSKWDSNDYFNQQFVGVTCVSLCFVFWFFFWLLLTLDSALQTNVTIHATTILLCSCEGGFDPYKYLMYSQHCQRYNYATEFETEIGLRESSVPIKWNINVELMAISNSLISVRTLWFVDLKGSMFDYFWMPACTVERQIEYTSI